MSDHQNREVAAALDATPELLPFIPELLADLWALGSSPELIVEWLRPLGLPPASTRVLDLGCGKGAVAIKLSRELGFQVLGVDLFEPFVEDARRRAEGLGVGDLCQFRKADLRDALSEARDFDIVIYASVGGVLGRLDQFVGALRLALRPGGYMVIDEGFLTEETALDQPGYEHLAAYDQTIKQLTAHGDALLREVIFSSEETRAMNRNYTELIRRRAEQLARRHPEAADSLFDYVKRQERECELFEKEVVAAVWLLQRG